MKAPLSALAGRQPFDSERNYTEMKKKVIFKCKLNSIASVVIAIKIQLYY